jgi:flagellar hook-length control protein FliK
MPEIAIIQAAAPQTSPQAPSANNNSPGFSPHLEKAIANRKDQASNDKNKVNESQEANKPSADQTAETSGTTASQASQESQETAEDLGGVKEKALTALETEGQTDNPEIPLVSQQLNNRSPLFDFLSNNPASATEDTGDMPVLLADKSQQNIGKEGLPLTSMEGNYAQFKAGNDLSTAVQPLATKSQQDVFLQQLQNIIENSDENGTPIITVTGNTVKEPPAARSQFFNLQPVLPAEILNNEQPRPVNVSSDLSEFSIDTSVLLSPESSEFPGENANQSLSMMRRTLQQQYFEEKIVPQIDSEDQASAEAGQQNDSFSPKAAESITEKAVSALISDQNNIFAQPISLGQEGGKSSTLGATQPITLPSGTIIQQEEVVRQIIERMQINRRDSDTRVIIQLHPAELGEVQISLSVKEGTIRANVVASSQYAQEIIEKNMGKLRTVLENQGFTIDQIAITSKSDTTGNFNLLDRQLFSKNDYTPSSSKKSHNTGDLFVEEDFSLPKHAAGNEINLNI